MPRFLGFAGCSAWRLTLSLSVLASVGGLGCGKKASSPSTPSPDPQISADARANLPGTASHGGVFRAQIAWTQPLLATEFTAAKVTLTDAAGAAVQSAEGLTFVPFMPTMGHGTAKNHTIAAVAGQPGVFLVDRIYFVMGGAWVITISATVNGKADQADVAVNL